MTGRNISNGRVVYENADYISENEYNNNRRFQLHINDTLITLKGKGSIGKIGFVTSDIPAIFSRNIGVVRPNNKIDGAYLNAYILSYYGHNMVLRGETGGTGQSTLTCSYLKTLNVPRLTIEKAIGDIIRKSEEIFIQSRQCISEAESMLHNELGINSIAVTDINVSQKRFSDFINSGRLDAEYYLPKYEEIVDKISQYPYEHDKIGNLYILRDKNFLPDDNARYKYIELSDIGVNGEISGCTYEYGSNLPSRARRIVHTGDIIISSIEGSLQSCAIITEEYDGALCSTGFYVLSPRRINSETSLVLFKSSVIQSLLKRACTGTILTAMNKDEFIAINLPVINKDIQNKIADIIRQSTILRSKSKHLLKLAETAVETAIEKGENLAMELLNLKG